ncbi:MAG TPA: DUF1634 domain-containing protein [Pirellulales bacterium]|nr:DUF1634 domain-containing protein [Pirellulales bacterium]
MSEQFQAGDTRWSEQRVDQFIGNLLRIGVSIAAAVVLVAGIIYLWQHGSQPADNRVFQGEPAELRSVRAVFKTTTHGNTAATVQFGLLLLIATPIARVIFSVYVFARVRDWLYVGITLTVLAILLYSLTGGGLE